MLPSVVLRLVLTAAQPGHAAPELVHCTAPVAASEGAWQATVQGYGESEEAARARLRLAGRHLSARALSTGLLAAVLDREVGVGGEGLDDVGVDPVLGLAGVALGEVSCAPASPAPPRGAAERELVGAEAQVLGVSVTRRDPGLAASTARRLACEAAWAAPFAAAFSEGAQRAPAERGEILSRGVEAARQALFDCHAAPVRFEPLAVTAPRHAPGTVSCVAHGWRPDDDLPAQAFSTDLQEAVDAASWERATQRGHQALAQALHAQSHSMAERRTVEVARAILDATEVVDSEGVELALSSCTLHPATGLTLAWQELPTPNLDPCARDWPPAQQALGEQPAAPAKAASCSALMESNLAQVHPAVRNVSTEMRPTLRAAAWSITLDCEARCTGRLLPADTGQRLAVPGPLARTPGEGVRLLAAAVEARDADALFVVMPTAAQPSQRAAMLAQPDRAWAALAGLVAQLQADSTPPGLRWRDMGGHVILEVSGPRGASP